MAKAEPTKYIAEDGTIDGQVVSYGNSSTLSPNEKFAFTPNTQGGLETYVVRPDGSYYYWGATTPAVASSLYGYTGYTPTASEKAQYEGALASAQSPTSQPPSQSSQAQSNVNAAAQQTDAEFNSWLATQNLTDDQKAAITAVYDAVSVNDAAKAKQVTEAMAAAAEFSDPYFKAQIALVTDNLARNFQSADGDLAFQSQQLTSSLQKLQDDIAASKDFMSFQTMQELKGLERKYEADIENTQNAMAATGFTQSTRRAKTEGLITDTFGDAVESSNRQLAYQTGNLDRQQSFAQQDTAAQIANIQRLVAEGKIDALRSAEAQVGTNNLSNLGYSGLLGGQGGAIPRAQVNDMTQFASGYAF